MDDRNIVKLYFDRDERAIAETKIKFDKYLKKIAFNILSSDEDSEESVNDTYLAAWNSIPPHSPDVLSTYLAKITRRISIDHFRKRNRDKRQASEYALALSELEDTLLGGTSPEDTLELKLLTEAIERFLSEQSPAARHVFIGRYFYCDSVRDVASYCNMSVAGVKSQLHRTRTKLREYLTKEGFII